jgi:hypothetical protein
MPTARATHQLALAACKQRRDGWQMTRMSVFG